MGYTHYWEWQAPIDPARFALWSADVKTIIDSLFLYPELATLKARLPAPYLYCDLSEDSILKICGPDGEGDPLITDEVVAFNGDAGNKLDHETFIIAIDPPTDFSFCKTAGFPYDLVVTAALIRLAHYFPNKQELTISSDGSPRDWEAGCQLCQGIFGEAVIPL